MDDSKYPMINKLGLCIYETWMDSGFPNDHVSAIELESYLQKSTRVYSDEAHDGWWKESQALHKSLTALLIAVEELPKKPIKIEQTFAATFEPEKIFKPLELTGKKFKVTFEEIIE
jgi:hypothetical protein